MTEVNPTELAQQWMETTGTTPPEHLLSSYFPRIDPIDVTAYGTRVLAASVARHYETARRYTGTAPAIDIHNPGPDDADYSGTRTVINLVNRDLRHLLSSLVAEVSGAGHALRVVRHPILVVEREGSDLRIVPDSDLSHTSSDTMALPVIAPGSQVGPAESESWVHIEIDRIPEEDFPTLRAMLERTVAYAAAAADDRTAMVAKAESIAADLRRNPPRPELAEQASEAAELLDWLDGRFAFEGYREYRLVVDENGSNLEPVEGSALGITKLRPASSSHLARTVAAKATDPEILVLTKANSRSHLIRRGYMDYLGIKSFDESGEIVGEKRFVGLYTAGMYNSSVLEIPVVKSKVNWVLKESGLARNSHSGNELLAVLESFPRDNLLHSSAREILDIAMSVVELQDKREASVFIRRDGYERFVSVLVYVPRDLYDTDSRMRVQQVLRENYQAVDVDFDVLLTDSALARLHFVARPERDTLLPEVDAEVVAERIKVALRSWSEDLWELLAPSTRRLESAELARARTWSKAFPAAYRDRHTPEEAVGDVTRFLALTDDAHPQVEVYRNPGEPANEIRLSFFRIEEASLSDMLPFLSNLGARVLDERPFELVTAEGEKRYIYDFSLAFAHEVAETDFTRIEEAFVSAWTGKRESGLMDHLIVSGLNWRQVSVLRAFHHYLRQAGFSLSDRYMGQVFTSNPEISSLLVEYFETKFDPDLDVSGSAREEQVEAINARIESALAAVASLDADRVLRAVLELVRATVRTNVYQPGDGSLPETLVFKVHPNELDFVPKPKPALEMWVYSPEVEGVHLRFGPVARGGLRWSDRRDDFRTEVLGLVKAQMVKNALIVPTGAKGGFYPKRLPDPSNREAWAAAGQQAYEKFINALLDVTDNLETASGTSTTVHPERTVIHDGDDTYLVVAADKGTARFSDVANSIAESRGFWLGDAFASGGSVGYDHKAMGITSRGAWKSVERHFRELGVNTAEQEFTAVGIGDMSGDVFGNGMLRSEHTLLVAAFDHRDIFLDPNPDAAASYAERRRLFELPRSSWQDYDRALISAGGGVFPRSSKSITLSDEAARSLGLRPGPYRPDELISGILKAPVDLVYNGGIGTYVKASGESHADVGDKANDAIRIDGAELRARVLGEGGNLGATQLGRVEAALAGVKLNTDAVDNSAGVDTSDHEVNIKLLLRTLIDSGEVAAADRESVLMSLTDDVAEAVLANNYAQNGALGDARNRALDMSGTQRRLMKYLEREAGLDRVVEFLPDSKTLTRRAEVGQGLSSSELSVLLAYVKMNAVEQILASTVPDEEWTDSHLVDYFPPRLGRAHAHHLGAHPLKREIATAHLVNHMVDRGGLTYVFRMQEETSASIPQIARVFTVVSEVFGLDAYFDAVCALDNTVPVSVQNTLFHAYGRLLDRASRWLVHQAPDSIDVDASIAAYASVVQGLRPDIPTLLQGTDRTELEDGARALVDRGVPQDLAFRAAGLLDEYPLLDVAQMSTRSGMDPRDAAEIYYGVTDLLSGAELLGLIGDLDRRDRWKALARGAMRDDYYQSIIAIVTAVAATTSSDAPTPQARADERIAQWRANNDTALRQVLETIAEVKELDTVDQAPLSVLLRMMRSIVRSSVWQSENA